MPEEKNDYGHLKEELSKMGQWVSYFQKKQEFLEKRVSFLENKMEIKQPEHVQENVVKTTQGQPAPKSLESLLGNNEEEEVVPQSTSKKTIGIFSIVVGALVGLGFFSDFNFAYLFSGLLLIILGSYLLSRKEKVVEVQKTTEKTHELQQDNNFITSDKKKETSFEEDIGMKWFAMIGILALVIGVGFFVKYAIDMNWINHLTRIILGVILGISLIIFGELISKKEKYINWGKTLVGGGIAITYFVIYAAYYFENYRLAIGINQTTDIIFLTVVVLFAIYLSIRDNSKITVAGAFSLGYITALLSNNFEVITLVYDILLSIGLVTVVAYKKWPVIGIAGIISAYFMHAVWMSDNPQSSFALVVIPLVIYFLSFSLQSFFLSKKEELWKQNIWMLLINSLLFFLVAYGKFEKFYPNLTGLFTLILAVFYFLSFYLYQTNIDKKTTTTNLYLGLFYLTITIPIQFNPELITFIWALETLLLTSLAFKLGSQTLKRTSYFVGLATIFKAVFYDTTELHAFSNVDFLNSTRMFSLLFTALCFYIIYKIFETYKEQIDSDDLKVYKTYSWLASGLLLLTIFLEFGKDYPFLVTILLSLLSLVYLFVSKVGKRSILAQSVVIFTLLSLKIFLYDSSQLHKFSFDNFFDSTRFFSFLIGITTLYIASLYLEKRKQLLEESEKYLPSVYSYIGSFLAFALIMLEMKDFWMSVGWSILALIILLVGIAYRKKYLRLQGMLIFAITILKVFIYDTRGLETLYRTISYMVLGIILLLVSFIYTKYKDKLKEII